MALSVNTNIASLFGQRMLNKALDQQSVAMQRLSSGMRINSARDDAAGLSISNGFTSQIKGTNQAIRNINDSISAIQTSDGALDSVTSNLQRIRELSVQAANDTNSASDRKSLAAEVGVLIEEIDFITSTTAFNGKNLFQRGDLPQWVDEQRQFNVDQMFGNWLAESERMIENSYGLKADGKENLSIVFDDDPNSEFAATVSYNTANDDSLSRATQQTLTLFTKAFPIGKAPDGGGTPNFSDRTIAHEMVHAVMGRTLDMDSLETWFKEGAAELIQGADESVLNQLIAQDDTTTHFNAADRAAYAADNTFFSAWDSTGKHYSQGYLAVRFLHEDIVANGGEGIKDVMSFLSDEANLAGGLTSLNDALAQLNTDGLTSYATDGALKTAFTTGADAFIQTLNFSNLDTGAIGGLDVDGGIEKTAESVVDNSNVFLSLKPLEGYNNVTVDSSGVVNPLLANQYNLKVGSESDSNLKIDFFQVNSSVLGLTQLDIETNPSAAINLVDRALGYISEQRANLGAISNRLASTIVVNESVSLLASNSRSRITDADFATETSQLSKQQILQQSSSAMISQANASISSILTLLS
ncbi:MAG: flagellinolysin [Colwellia sp.]|nr:flagellinolysin [Colwellia sp.]